MSKLSMRPKAVRGLVHDLAPEGAGWGYVGFQLYRMGAGETASGALGEHEANVVYV